MLVDLCHFDSCFISYLVAALVVDGAHVDGTDGAHAEHEEEGQADVDDGGELILV